VLIAQQVIDLLQCPVEGAALTQEDETLKCFECGATYPLAEGFVDFGDLIENERETELLDYYENTHPGCDLRMTPWKVEQLLLITQGIGGVKTLLDTGCGVGEVTRGVGEALQVQTAIGIDWSRVMLRAAGQAHDSGVPCGWLRANVNRLPLKDDAIDLMLAVDIVEHVVDPPVLFGEAYRVARQFAVKIPIGGRMRPWRRNFGHICRF